MVVTNIPSGAREAIRVLTRAGYEAYLVGGCVRDTLLARSGAAVEIHDWDICTNATPAEMRSAFAGYRTIETGAKHGTITVLMSDGQYEATTYRIDGAYSDARHPDSVAFTSNVAEDLARRDFTINAMAMGIDEGGNVTELIDPFGGREDLARGLLKCVGEAQTRFEEDALRILRGIRFAARLGLTIEPATRDAMLDKRALLERISPERIMDELGKILLTDRGWEYLTEYRDILTEIVPELRACGGCAQRTPWHCYDVFEHTMVSVGSAPKDLTLRLTMLLHDVGKPETATTDENGVSHFYGHAERSAEIAENVLRRLRCPAQLTRDVTELVRCHGIELAASEKLLRRRLNQFGTEQVRRLLQVKRADVSAQSEPARTERLDELARTEELLMRVLAEKQAFSRKDLAINGDDLLARGVAPGREIGARLERALNAVIDGAAPNERDALLEIALQDEI